MALTQHGRNVLAGIVEPPVVDDINDVLRDFRCQLALRTLAAGGMLSLDRVLECYKAGFDPYLGLRQAIEKGTIKGWETVKCFRLPGWWEGLDLYI